MSIIGGKKPRKQKSKNRNKEILSQAPDILNEDKEQDTYFNKSPSPTQVWLVNLKNLGK